MVVFVPLLGTLAYLCGLVGTVMEAALIGFSSALSSPGNAVHCLSTGKITSTSLGEVGIAPVACCTASAFPSIGVFRFVPSFSLLPAVPWGLRCPGAASWVSAYFNRVVCPRQFGCVPHGRIHAAAVQVCGAPRFHQSFFISEAVFDLRRSMLLFGLVALVTYCLATFVIPRVSFTARGSSGELFLLSILSVCLVFGSTTDVLGLGMEMGALCAGLLVSLESDQFKAIEKQGSIDHSLLVSDARCQNQCKLMPYCLLWSPLRTCLALCFSLPLAP